MMHVQSKPDSVHSPGTQHLSQGTHNQNSLSLLSFSQGDILNKSSHIYGLTAANSKTYLGQTPSNSVLDRTKINKISSKIFSGTSKDFNTKRYELVIGKNLSQRTKPVNSRNLAYTFRPTTNVKSKVDVKQRQVEKLKQIISLGSPGRGNLAGDSQLISPKERLEKAFQVKIQKDSTNRTMVLPKKLKIQSPPKDIRYDQQQCKQKEEVEHIEPKKLNLLSERIYSIKSMMSSAQTSPNSRIAKLKDVNSQRSLIDKSFDSIVGSDVKISSPTGSRLLSYLEQTKHSRMDSNIAFD